MVISTDAIPVRLAVGEDRASYRSKSGVLHGKIARLTPHFKRFNPVGLCMIGRDHIESRSGYPLSHNTQNANVFPKETCI